MHNGQLCSSLPEALLELLRDASVIKACVGLRGCRTTLDGYFCKADEGSCLDGAIDISLFAVARKLAKPECASLRQLVSSLLQRDLVRDGQLRFGKWHVAQLEPAMATYAASGE
jgi:hypothetical protein